MSGFDIGHRHVGDGAECLIVGEVGLAHEGSVATAHAYVDAVAMAGAGAVKFQCHLPEECAEDEPWRVEPPWRQDVSRREYWRRTGFTEDQWRELADHAEAVKVEFLCSPFSTEAVDMLDMLVPAWKVPSGELLNEPMMRAITATEKPVLLSTGMCTAAELRGVVDRWGWPDRAIMHCTSMYPCPADRVGLPSLVALNEEYGDPTGFSDHSGGIYAGIGAATIGCAILEVHVCFSRHQFGLDVSSSLTMSDLGRLVEGVRFVEKARLEVDGDALARGELVETRNLFMGKWRRKP